LHVKNKYVILFQDFEKDKIKDVKNVFDCIYEYIRKVKFLFGFTAFKYLFIVLCSKDHLKRHQSIIRIYHIYFQNYKKIIDYSRSHLKVKQKI